MRENEIGVRSRGVFVQISENDRAPIGARPCAMID